MTISMKPSSSEAIEAAKAWVAALCGNDASVSELRSHSTFPFIQKDLEPPDPRGSEACEGKNESNDPSAFDEVAKCMLGSEIANPLTTDAIIAGFKVVKPRAGSWRPPYRRGISDRLKDHVFVRSRWEVGCDRYTLTLAIRHTAEGAAISLAFLDGQVLCE
jgi:hypothetical protein